MGRRGVAIVVAGAVALAGLGSLALETLRAGSPLPRPRPVPPVETRRSDAPKMRGRTATPPPPARGAAEPTPAPSPTPAPVEVPPEATWTDRFLAHAQRGQWAELDALLEAIRRDHPDRDAAYRLGYLQARARLESGRAGDALSLFEPFLAASDPWRDLALHHAARAAEAAGDAARATALRQQLVRELPGSPFRSRAAEAVASALERARDVDGLRGLLDTLGTSAPASLRRRVEATIVSSLVHAGRPQEAAELGLGLMRQGQADDAAGRVAEALDRPEVLSLLDADDRITLGEVSRAHRRSDRAVALLTDGLAERPRRSDELLFSIGRAHFAAERYAEAEEVYLRGAARTADREQKATFYYHASRCAQLLGDDQRGLRHLGAAIAHGGRARPALSALTQRIRTRVDQGRLAEAASDLSALRRRAGRDHAVLEGTLAYAVGAVAAGRDAEALRAFRALPRRIAEETAADRAEQAYWRARAQEKTAPAAAVREYLRVLDPALRSGFAPFARERVRALGPSRAAVRAERAAAVEQALEAGRLEAAREAQTDVVLLSTEAEQPAALAALREVYGQIGAYRSFLAIAEPAFPRLPLDPAAEVVRGCGKEELRGRYDLLLALGLFDDAASQAWCRFPVESAASGLAQAEALRLGGAFRGAIRAAEIAIKEEPDDFVAALRDPRLQAHLYPPYYLDLALAEAPRVGVDARLVLAVMRQESRFDPRALSGVGARGLLQFMMPTATEVAKAAGLGSIAPDDLYQPPVIVRLGALYLADLQERLQGNLHAVAAAYNAGPQQARLWVRLAAGEGLDYFLSAVNFAETKDYAAKVTGGLQTYRELLPDVKTPAH